MFAACLELLVLLDIIIGYCCSVVYNNLTVFESPNIPHPSRHFTVCFK